MLRAAILFAMAMAGFAATYSVVVIPSPSGFTDVYMGGINSSGQVAVSAYASPGGSAVFIGSASGITPVPLPSGWTSGTAFAVNTSGQVAGTVFNGTASAAFIGATSGSALIPLPNSLPSSGFNSYGYALNDSGQVVGTILNVNFASPAFVGTPSESTLFPSPGYGPSQPTGLPNAINNSGLVAGAIVTSYFLSGSAGTISAYQEFIGTPAGVTIVATPSGYASAEPWAINASGQVAGIALTEGILYVAQQAFLGTNAGSTLIPFPARAGTSRVFNQSINDFGVVVGYSDLGGWIWDANNGTRLLNSLVPDGWNVTSAISISNNGLVLAQATYQDGASQYVELIPTGISPTPAPSTLVLLLMGAMVTGAWLRWARFGTATIGSGQRTVNRGRRTSAQADAAS